MQLKLDPRNAIPVLELVPNLLVSEIFKRLTTSAWDKVHAVPNKMENILAGIMKKSLALFVFR